MHYNKIEFYCWVLWECPKKI